LKLPKNLFAKGLKNKVSIEFYPYKNMKNTIREKNGGYLIRLSDMLLHAPDEVKTSICCILLLRILDKRVPREISEVYKNYTDTEEVDTLVRNRRKKSGRKLMNPPQGDAYDLEEMFASINKKYFKGELIKPLLGFSLRRTRTRWGHYDPILNSITISRTLDNMEVPRYVTEFVLYHEMLHMVYDTKREGDRRSYHYAEFKNAEKQFPKSKEAQKWLRSLAGQLRKARGRKKI